MSRLVALCLMRAAREERKSSMRTQPNTCSRAQHAQHEQRVGREHQDWQHGAQQHARMWKGYLHSLEGKVQ
jgi:hypothetical protein